MTRELLQQALDALINGRRVRDCEGGTRYQPDLEDAAITALRSALAAPQPEPSDMVMVPREPTQAMCAAAVVFANGNAVYKNVLSEVLKLEESIYAEVYEAMIAAAPAPVVPDELSPEFTDTARNALLWVLWHHQGASSAVGQPIRFALGMGAHDRLNERQIAQAKQWAATTGSTTAEFHKVSAAPVVREPLTDEQVAAGIKAWFTTEIAGKNQPFEGRMRAAYAAIIGIGGGK